MKLMPDFVAQPYYLTHLFTVVLYLFLRKMLTLPHTISVNFYLWVTKEQAIFVIAFMLVIFRYKKYSTREQMFISLTNHLKIGILVNLVWSYSYKLAIIYACICVIPQFLMRIPKYKGPSNILDIEEQFWPVLFPYGKAKGTDLEKERRKVAKSEIKYTFGMFCVYIDIVFIIIKCDDHLKNKCGSR